METDTPILSSDSEYNSQAYYVVIKAAQLLLYTAQCEYYGLLLGQTVLKVLKAIITVPIEKWQFLGLLLGLEQSIVRQMSMECGNDFDTFKMNFVTTWLNTGNATWKDLINALKDELVGQNAVANNIVV